MLVVESSMAGGRKEVALAAIAVITTLMQAHGTTKAVSRRYCHPHYPLHVSCSLTQVLPHLLSYKPMTQPRQSHAGLDALAIFHVCRASPWHHQGSLAQVLSCSQPFMHVLQACSTTKGTDSGRYCLPHYPSKVSCKPMTPPRHSHAGIATLTILVKRQEKTTPFRVNFVRSQVLYQTAQPLTILHMCHASP